MSNALADDPLAFGRALAASFSLSPLKKVSSGSAGELLGASVGSSLEFQDYRGYQPGDDIRRLDWKAYARSDKLTLRLYREEIQPRTDLICDLSDSMKYPHIVKAHAALAVSAALLDASMRSSCASAWWSFGNGAKNIFRLSNIFPDVSAPDFGGSSPIGDDFAKIENSLGKKGIRIIVSDFLWEIPASDLIRRFARNCSTLLLISVLSKEEIEPPVYGTSSLLDSETSSMRLDLDITEAHRKRYMERLRRHLEMWKDASIAHGSVFCQILAEDLAEGDCSSLSDAGIIEFF